MSGRAKVGILLNLVFQLALVWVALIQPRDPYTWIPLKTAILNFWIIFFAIFCSESHLKDNFIYFSYLKFGIILLDILIIMNYWVARPHIDRINRERYENNF